MFTHLLQSTVFAAAIWLVNLALRRHHARARHALWMAASVKFLLPFSLFVTLGSQLVRQPAAPVPAPQMRFVIADVAPSMAPIPAASKPVPARHDWRPAVVWFLWWGGCAAILIRWYARWRVAAVTLRESAPWSAAGGLPVPVRRSASAIEPGVVGIFRPVLLVPAGIEDRLSAGQLQAVFAHELCHVRHRDNLAAAIHMLVEAIFWFHPLVWWIGARLVEERERACDEEVLQLGSDRVIYAESILRVCEFCLESPMPCVSGITGADLKLRIRNIMSGRVGARLEPGKKALLAALGIAALAVPLAVGLMHPAKMRAQSPLTAAPLHFEAASLKLSEDQSILETHPKRPLGRFRWKTQLAYLVSYAYNLEWWRIPDFPGQGRIYEVEATLSPNTTQDQERLMLQALLVERFKMVVHRETKTDVAGYTLTVAPNGPKMEVVKEDAATEDPNRADEWVSAHGPASGIIEIDGHRANTLQLADQLQRLLSTSVLDRTGLSGKYNFTAQFSKGDDPQDFTGVISAMKQIGLKLEKYKGPVEFLVIDHIEKTPTEN